VWIDARSSLHPINSRTMGLGGWLDADIGDDGRLNPAVTPQARLELPVDLLTSGNLLYDREMRRRIGAKRYPTISGELRFMKEGREAGRYLVGGDVSFRGVTRSYEDEMSLAMLDDHTVRLSGERTFDVREFGMEPPRILTLRVHPDVVVKVEIVATDGTPKGEVPDA
jgi:polyisoprenoid-binding protein YceI